MTTQHATSASIHHALGEYLTDGAPEVIGVYISRDHVSPEGAMSYYHYTASVHIHEPEWAAWLERTGFTRDDVLTTDRNEDSNTESVTRGDGVTLFAIVDKPAEAGESA